MSLRKIFDSSESISLQHAAQFQFFAEVQLIEFRQDREDFD